MTYTRFTLSLLNSLTSERDLAVKQHYENNFLKLSI